MAFSSGFPRGPWPRVCSLGAAHGQKAALSLKMRGGGGLGTARAAWLASFSAASRRWDLPDANGTALGFCLKDRSPFPVQRLLILSVCSNPNKARASSDSNLFRERVVLTWTHAVLTLGFAVVTRPGGSRQLGKQHLPQVFLGSSSQRRDFCGPECTVPKRTTGSAVSTRPATSGLTVIASRSPKVTCLWLL